MKCLRPLAGALRRDDINGNNWRKQLKNTAGMETSHVKTEKYFNIRTTFASRPENSSPGSSVRNAIIYSSRRNSAETTPHTNAHVLSKQEFVTANGLKNLWLMVFLTQHVRYVLMERGLHEVGKQTVATLHICLKKSSRCSSCAFT